MQRRDSLLRWLALSRARWTFVTIFLIVGSGASATPPNGATANTQRRRRRPHNAPVAPTPRESPPTPEPVFEPVVEPPRSTIYAPSVTTLPRPVALDATV